MSDLIDAIVALTGTDLSHLNTLVPFETRRIVLAQGKQFRNGDPSQVFDMPAVLRLPGKDRVAALGKDAAQIARVAPSLLKFPAIPLSDGPNGSFQFFNVDQGVLFTIEVVNTKTEYIKAMLTPEVHLIYAGHARFGRGPCFGSGGDSKGEEWEEGHGAHPNADGIFRMGFPFIPVPVGDLFEHGYTANITRSDVHLPAADCDPDLRNRLGGLTPHTLDEIAKIAVKTHEFKNDDELKVLTLADIQAGLQAQVRDADPAARYWTFQGGNDINVVHHAGWEDTLSDPDDLGDQTPLCRVFCHFGCSSFHHNFPVLRKLKKWTHEGNERYAFWTTDLSDFTTDIYYLQHLLTFDQFNANQSWDKCLNHAVQKTNAALAHDRQRYRLI